MMTQRRITHRTRGKQTGFIRRMVSPSDLGEVLKPFLFLDYICGPVPAGAGFGWHPHSGLATLTYSLNADVQYEDTTGQRGTVAATGLEWMQSGGGTWHQGFIHPRDATVTSFQLWVALPPGIEDGDARGIYVAPSDVPQQGNVRVLLGSYQDHSNPIPAPGPITYIDVVLSAGETWTFVPAAEHDVAWAFVYRGRAELGAEAISDELVVFEEGHAPISFQAQEETRILIGSAKKHPHKLVLGQYSVHTNATSLDRGKAKIRSIGEDLKRAGRR